MNLLRKVSLSAAVLICGVFLHATAFAAGFTDWRDGDLIFQNSGSGQSTAILTASGSPYSHVGMIKLTPKGPVVVEAAGLGVKEASLRSFIARGENGHYAVYRIKNLSRGEALKALTEARKYYGHPYDPFFRPDKERIYCSELVWLAFQPQQHKIGQSVPFSALNIDNPVVRHLFENRWRFHPDCKIADGAEACWAKMMKQTIVTPGSLVADKTVTEKLYSNFDDASTGRFSMLRQVWRYMGGPTP